MTAVGEGRHDSGRSAFCQLLTPPVDLEKFDLSVERIFHTAASIGPTTARLSRITIKKATKRSGYV